MAEAECKMAKRIAIIGAGCSGLTAIKSCIEEGLIPVCFEREDDIGGLWNYSDENKPDKGSVYYSCCINTSKEMMAFSDFPVPSHFPPFMPHSLVLQYFRLYAEHFNLMPYIQFNTTVENVQPSQDYERTGRWDLITRKSDDTQSAIEMTTFDGVMVCSGHHCYPYSPSIPDLERFAGPTIHSHEFKRADPFQGKRVLIIGIGNSAVDIAVDLSRVAKQVYVSTRRGAWIVSRMGPLGIPADALANSRFLFALPTSWLQWMVELMANFRFSHRDYGLEPQHRALEAHPTINDELPFKIMTGSVQVRRTVQSFSDDSVTFDDGIREKIDAVILATGYQYNYTFLPKDILNTEGNRVHLYKYMYPPQLKHPTLGVVGLVQAIGAVMPISEMQSRVFARVIQGKNVLPNREQMVADIDRKKTAMSQQYVDSQRHTLQTFWVPFMDELADLIGVRPQFGRLFLQRPRLAVRCFLGPCVSAQYRLHGPGSDPERATQIIRRAFSNNSEATMTRKVDTRRRTWPNRRSNYLTLPTIAHTKMLVQVLKILCFLLVLMLPNCVM